MRGASPRLAPTGSRVDSAEPGGDVPSTAKDATPESLLLVPRHREDGEFVLDQLTLIAPRVMGNAAAW